MKTTRDRRRRHTCRTKPGGTTLALFGLLLPALALGLLPARSLGRQGGPPPAPRGGEAKCVVAHGFTNGEWPSALVHQFGVERSDKTPFHGLKAEDFRIELDGKRIDPKAYDLQQATDRRVKVLLLIDGSGSMSPQPRREWDRSPEPDKLPAAKKALTTFVDQLGEEDIAAVYAFDRGVWQVVAPTPDKDRLKEGINGFKLRWRGGDPHYTYLYSAILEALQRARDEGIQNLVVLSDGIDYTEDNKPSIDAGQGIGPYKERNEQEIKSVALKEPKVHILTIAVGDENGVGNARVDRESLANISDPTIQKEKRAIYVSLPEVLNAAKEGEGKVSELLADRLRGSFEEIRKLLKSEYKLTMRPPAGLKQDDEEHFITITSDVCGEEKPYTLAYTWPRGGAFTLKQVDEGRPQKQLYTTAPAKTEEDRFGLAKIYLGLLSLLTVLGLAPVATRRLAESGAARQVWSAVVEVKDSSPFVGQECPNEGDGLAGEYLIKTGDVLVVCPNPECRTPHHMDCWHLAADHCWRRACQRHLPIPQHLLKRHGFAEVEGGLPE